MKIIRNYLFFALIGALSFIVACESDEDPGPNSPGITGPTDGTVVQVYGEKSIDFTVNTKNGYASSTVVATNGTATIESEPTAGATTGTLKLKYMAEDLVDMEELTVTVTDEESKTVTIKSTVNVSNILTEDMTWKADKIKYLDGRIIIGEDVTLTLEKGAIIKGREGSETSASVLIVSRGGKIMANGTADEPIIFTSELDNIELGETKGTNLEKEDNQKWGGLIILGSAPISAGEGDTEASIEGLPADEPFAKYGGDKEDDNSGELEYVSIRHGGITIGSGNEINGLTLGGVGNKTKIENIEVYATLDDGIEMFGGTVNVANIMVTWQGDDGVDIDMNYSGSVKNFVITHGEGVGTDEGLEIDGPEGSTNTDGLFHLMNGTIMNDGKEGSAADFKSKSQGTVENIKFMGYTSANVKIRASYQNDCLDAKTDAFTHLTQTDPILKFMQTNFDGNTVYTESQNNAETADCSVDQADQDAADVVMISDNTATGADMSVFDWTLTAQEGLLEE